MPLRRATTDDLPLLEEFENACFPDPWSRSTLSQVMAQERYLIWMSESSYLIASKICEEAEIERIGVLEAARGQGLGRQILQFTLEKLEAVGVEQVFLEVRASNAAALGLYGRCGFQRIGLRRGYYPDGQDAILMSIGLARG